MATTRREFLRTGWKVGGGLLAAAAAWTAYESLSPLASASSGGPLNLGSPSQYAPGSATYVPQGRLFVAHTGTEIYALSQKCPHLGCRVPFCDSSGRFECPCHGSKYDLGGEWVQGPAPRGTAAKMLNSDSMLVMGRRGANATFRTSLHRRG